MKEGWEYKKLGAVADFYRGLTYKREDEVDSSDNCVLRSNNIDLESMSLNFDELKYIKQDFIIPEEKKLKANSVFVCMSNGSKQHVGKVAYIKDNMDYAFGGFMGLIVPKRVIEGKYIYYICRSSLYRQFLTQIGNGIGITNLRFSDLNNFSLPVPPLSEQQHIVEELDLLSSIIEKKKAQLNELDNLAQSLFYEMFGDPITNDKGWKVKELKSICSKITDGTHDTPQRLDKGVKFITGKHIRPFSVDYDNSDYVTEEVHKEIILRCNPEKGDVLYTNIGAGIGNAAINTVDYEFSMKNVALLKLCKIIVNGYYMEFYLNNDFIKTNIIENFSNGGAQKFLSLKSIARIPVPIPPYDLQTQFASKIEAIEHQKELIKKSIKEVETLFNSRMDYYFN